MTTINLKEFFYWYTTDKFVEVSEEVAEELRADKRYEAAHRRRLTRNKAQYSLDAGDGIENAACKLEPSQEMLVIQAEQTEYLCRALNSLNDIQGRRVEAHILMGKSFTAIGKEEGVSAGSISHATKIGLRNMKRYLRKFYFGTRKKKHRPKVC